MAEQDPELIPSGMRVVVNHKDKTVAFIAFVDRAVIMTLEYDAEGLEQLIEVLQQAYTDLTAGAREDHQGERQ